MISIKFLKHTILLLGIVPFSYQQIDPNIPYDPEQEIRDRYTPEQGNRGRYNPEQGSSDRYNHEESSQDRYNHEENNNDIYGQQMNHHDDSITSMTTGLSPRVQDIADAYWKWKTSEFPEFATWVGIYDYDNKLNDISEIAMHRRLETVNDFLESAQNALASSSNNKEDSITLKILVRELENFIESLKYKWIYMPINYRSGIHRIKRLLEFMRKETNRDYENVLSRLKSIPKQIDQNIELMKAGQASGAVLNVYSLVGLNESLSKHIVENGEDSELFEVFQEMPNSFSPQEINNFQIRAQEIIVNQISPAFLKLKKFIEEMYVPRSDISISGIPNGEEFYDFILRQYLGPGHSPQEIHDIGLEQIEIIENLMQEVIRELGQNYTVKEYSNIIKNDPQNYFTEPEDLIRGFKSIVEDRIKPVLSRVFHRIPSIPLDIKGDPRPKSGAYYISSNEEGSRPGVFYVNVNDLSIRPTYGMLTLTLHEGYPGHHLERSHSLQRKLPTIRRRTGGYGYLFPQHTAYVEGWALYAEKLGFEMDLFASPLERYGYYSSEALRAVRLVVDTGIHALGWSREKAIEYMCEKTAFTRTACENQIDRYITIPGQALSYKIGELKILELREKAEKTLGEKFDVKEFHTVVLDMFGPLDLLEETIDEWIEMKKGQTLNIAGVNLGNNQYLNSVNVILGIIFTVIAKLAFS